MKEYFLYNLEELFMLGYTDAINDGIKQTEKIIEDLTLIFNKNEIIERVTSYLNGYKIGILENKLRKIEGFIKFDFQTKTFLTYSKKKIKFNQFYKVLENESKNEITLSLNRRK